MLFLADGTTLDIRLDRERISIGRRADNDVCLPYPAVSGEHAAVVTILSDSFLEDSGSTNGTLVNGKPVAKHFLRDRDQIDIGRQKLVYVIDESVKLEPSPQVLGRLEARIFGERVPAARVPAAVIVPEAGMTRGVRPVAPAAPPRPPPMPMPMPIVDVQRFVAAELAADARASERGRSAEFPAAISAPGTGAVVAPAADDAVIRVLTGPNAGRALPLNKAVTSIGRVGRQVAAIHRDGDLFRLLAVEGGAPPTVNGEPLGSDGATLESGDVVEIAGVRLEFQRTEAAAAVAPAQ